MDQKNICSNMQRPGIYAQKTAIGQVCPRKIKRCQLSGGVGRRMFYDETSAALGAFFE